MSRGRQPGPHRHPAGRSAALAAALGLLALAGCGGHGQVEIAALNFAAIDPPGGPPPRFVRLRLDRCCWWLDEAGKVWVALERERPSPFGRLAHFRFQLSLALDEPPAGSARDYLVSRRQLRAVARYGPAESRFVSQVGIVALYRAPGDRLRGSFRLQVGREARQLLGGWSRPARYLMMGTFEAVRDEARGRRIAEQTESHGWEREPPPGQPAPATSQPAPGVPGAAPTGSG